MTEAPGGGTPADMRARHTARAGAGAAIAIRAASACAGSGPAPPTQPASRPASAPAPASPASGAAAAAADWPAKLVDSSAPADCTLYGADVIVPTLAGIAVVRTS
jgi:hypothetical protein